MKEKFGIERVNMPQFVIDLLNGGGKRLVSFYDSYDRETGIGTFYSP
jgi:lysine 2,3-aminomutase